eukprot:CAMPEP_0194283884 /NCGR_PEP_ID=MMETSP0169-20130528/26325_1 /TAXON_ID=218684 /ORGANISM="Corethron pennatum, Strain L29A3" /LENGTH=459 /DNA_ID=CAMNT_0039029575 /DNA_START=21 /DNA_END=1400 /DNA_ORIENTATION=+
MLPILTLLTCVLDWGRQNGALISESIAIRPTVYGGKGMFATEDIPASTELIRIPDRLQLGVTQLAEGDDAEMQDLARSLPWRDVIDRGLTFLPAAISVCAELRRGDASVFCDYLRMIPAEYSNAVAPWDGTGDGDDPPPSLSTSAPVVAAAVGARRRTMRLVHDRLAPPSLSLRDLCWASAVVTSRAFTRARPRVPAPGRIGHIAAADATRILPAIDACNHGGPEGANAEVKNRDGGGPDPHSASLLSTRAIAAGEEVLLDYSGGRGLANDKLLLDYGFVLPENRHDTAALRLVEDLLPALPTIDGERAGMQNVAAEDLAEIQALIVAVAASPAARAQGTPVLFGPNGRPSLPTLALALALSCRGPGDVARILAPVREARGTPDGDDSPSDLLLKKIVFGADGGHQELAGVALRAAAAAALVRMSLSSDAPSGAGAFDDMARQYCDTHRETLQRAAMEV